MRTVVGLVVLDETASNDVEDRVIIVRVVLERQAQRRRGANLLDRNELGDKEKAIELQDEAIAVAQELGMKPRPARVLAQREILKA